MPTDRRTSPSVIPMAARRSGATAAWVCMAGCPMRLSTPPRLSARAKIRVFSTRPRARSRDPTSMLIIPVNPFICRRASSCCGWDGSPG